MSCDCKTHDIDKVTDFSPYNIYIANYNTAICPYILDLYSIKTVINCSTLNYTPINGINYTFMYSKDVHGFQIFRHFRRASKIIDVALQTHNVLDGLSRSPTLAVGYLISYKKV
jgi:hypothetical protein